MTEYLLLFRNVSGHSQYISSPEDMIADMPKWQSWISEIAAQGKFVGTQPIDYEGRVITNGGVENSPYLKANELIAGYLICKAESFEEAVAFGKTCPILKYPQASVEVRPITPFPL